MMTSAERVSPDSFVLELDEQAAKNVTKKKLSVNFLKKRIGLRVGGVTGLTY